MSRRYWSSEPSSNDDFLLFGVEAIRGVSRGRQSRRRWELLASKRCPARSGRTGFYQCTRSPSRVQRTWVSQARSFEESGTKLKYTTSGRPRTSESGTKPQYLLSSELSRLSPSTKYRRSGTTNGPQLFRDG